MGDFYVIFYIIFGDFLVGTGEPLPYCNKITLLYGCGFGLKKLGLADPPPQLGQNPKQLKKIDLKAPLRWKLRLLEKVMRMA